MRTGVVDNLLGSSINANPLAYKEFVAVHIGIKNSVFSWNFCTMSKQLCPLSTPTTVSHSGVEFLALIPIPHSKCKTKRCLCFIKQTQHCSVFFIQTVNATINYDGKELSSFHQSLYSHLRDSPPRILLSSMDAKVRRESIRTKLREVAILFAFAMLSLFLTLPFCRKNGDSLFSEVWPS